MKKSGLLILAAGAVMFLAMPAMAQKKVTLQEIQKSEQKAQSAEIQTINDGDVGTPGKAVANAPLPGNVPLTCTWDKTEHDFAATVMHQKPAKATYTITNAGKTPVTISEVITTCGCTSPNYTKEPIKPGEKGSVSLTYDSKITGFFTKNAIVKLNDGQKYILTIKGEVQKVDDGSNTGK
jgi:hypothetical protein